VAVQDIDTDLLRAYVNGYVATVEAGNSSAVLPTNGTSPLSGDYFGVGALTEDGIAEAIEQDVTDVFIWQNGALGRRIKGNTTKTWTFAAAETNLVTLGVHYSGSTITQTAEGVTVEEKPPGVDVRPWVLHCIDGSRLLRIVVPRGEVTERGETPINGTGLTIYEWTLSAYPDSAGNLAYRYYVDDALAAAS
jgi:hypothetical protein